MKREISPMIAIIAILVLVVLAGSIYFYSARPATSRAAAGPGGLNAQASKGSIPQQTSIPKASGQ